MRNIEDDNDDDYELTETIKRQSHFVTVLQQELSTYIAIGSTHRCCQWVKILNRTQ